MKKLKIKLQPRTIIYFICFLSFITLLARLQIKSRSVYKNTSEISGFVTKVNIEDNILTLHISNKETIIGTYNFKNNKEKNNVKDKILLHDYIKVKGDLEKISNEKENTLFDYQKYYERKNIFNTFKIKEIYIISKNKNLYYKLKNYLIKRCENNYLKTFILGDTTSIDYDVLSSYRTLGISHLLAISGMHISLFSTFILKLLEILKLNNKKRYFITNLILIFYLFLVGFSPSILRAVLFFFLYTLNKLYNLKMKNLEIFLLTLSISIIVNPHFIYNVAFYYSLTISLFLIIMKDKIKNIDGYIKKLLFLSTTSFICSIPISIYFFNQINILSIIYNLFYVPFISYIVFPLSLITFIFPMFESFFNIFTNIMEVTSNLLCKITFPILILKRPSIFILLLYVVFTLLFIYGLKYMKKLYHLPLVLLLLIHSLIPFVDQRDYILMIDVGQGDSILMHSNNKNILVDTGGVMNYYGKERKYNITKKTTLPLLKREGIKKLDYLILTHGDYDHIGEAIYLIKKIKIDNIYINEGNINTLEKELVDNFLNVKILKQNEYMEIGDFKILSLNKKISDDENDNSIVLYIEIRNEKILLMGDASIRSEKQILDNYNISNIDILKCGHHGSKTSSSSLFLKTMNPSVALISAGVNNRYNHPNKEVIDRLKEINANIKSTQDIGNIKIYL